MLGSFKNSSITIDDGQVDHSAHLRELKRRVHQRLLEVLNLDEARRMPAEQLQSECLQRVETLLNEQDTPLSATERVELLRGVMDEIFGFGPLEEYLRDPAITDILVNGHSQVYIEREGRLELTNTRFQSDDHVRQVIQRIASQVGRRIDESSPMLDARLLDGSRVNAVIPPLALDGPCLSIRRFGTRQINASRLRQLGAVAEEMMIFLQACVRSKLNMLISGGTGAGKTTLLNVLSHFIPPEERVLTIEDAAELCLQRDHVVRLETRPPNIEDEGQVTQRDLLRNSLRMRPDRIIIGEVRGAEALDMLQAMNTGHEGSMTTVHANNPRDALTRIENMVSMAGLNFPVRAIRQQMVAALNLVVHVSRLTGGKRRLVSITEITGMEGDVVCVQELFRYRQTDIGTDGHAIGRFESCGVRPRIMERLSEEGFKLPRGLFERRVLTGALPVQRRGKRNG